MSDQPGARSLGTYDPSQRGDDTPGATTTAEKPKKAPRPKAAPEAPKLTAGPTGAEYIGLPVQYHDGQRVVPATLVRESVTKPGLWDLAIIVTGGFSIGRRYEVAFADTPTPTCWSYQPFLKP